MTKLNNPPSIVSDLTWIDLLKGLAIIGVFMDNWTIYFDIHFTLWGPWVQVFFILSGFGLSLTYLNRQANWQWTRWAWRRVTKIMIPYILVVFFSFALGIVGAWVYALRLQFSWMSLLACLTLTRNFYPPAWIWNPPTWFMPVIVGLYLCFPLLTWLANKGGFAWLVLLSALATYGSLTLAVLTGNMRGHEADLFTYWLIQFALGMALAYIRNSQPQKLRYLIGPAAFMGGVALIGFSWVLVKNVPFGEVYNDLLTSIGMFLVLLNLAWFSRWLTPLAGQILSQLGRVSFLMFLVHFPIMLFGIGPLLKPIITNSITGTILGGVYIGVIYLLCRFISAPMDKLSAAAYQWLYPPYQI